MRRHTVRSLASILIWIGGVELFASFLTRVLFHMTIPYSSIFIGLLLVGFFTWVFTTAFYQK
ncbi:MAG: hypothetical protein ACXVDE_05725 [Tumebacillaceae bacterium]